MFYGKAIESGDLNALIKLSNYYFVVHNISENLKLAKRLFKRIIKNPHLNAILRISGCHESANSPSPFSISPIILFEKLIPRGFTIGCLFLGEYYETGEIVTQNYTKAFEY
jgi:TPR repeat protein